MERGKIQPGSCSVQRRSSWGQVNKCYLIAANPLLDGVWPPEGAHHAKAYGKLVAKSKGGEMLIRHGCLGRWPARIGLFGAWEGVKLRRSFGYSCYPKGSDGCFQLSHIEQKVLRE